MSTRINTNVEAFTAQRNLSMTAMQYSKSVEKLSSGLRINRAGDDAAGLSISEKLRAQIKGLAQAQRNAQDGISMIQTAEGALNETHSILQRMRELGVQAANGTLSSSDQTAVSSELNQLKSEIDRIAQTTQFNGTTLLTGTLQSTNAGTGTFATAGMVLANSSAAVDSIQVSGARAGTYTFSESGNDLTLSTTIGGTTTSQTIVGGVAALTTAGATRTLDFSTLGVKVNLTGGNANATNANLTSDFGTKTIVVTGNANANLQIGANVGGGNSLTVGMSDAQSTGVGTYSGSNLSQWISAFQSAIGGSTYGATVNSLISSIDQAISDISSNRGNLGAYQNRLEHTIANLGVSQENLTASESRIRDVDMAAEMVNFTKTGILQQAGQSILSQANSAPQGILQLLRG